MDTIIAVVIAILGSSGLWAYITSRQDRNDELKEALVGLMGFTIRDQCERAIEKGSISSETLKQIENLNETYKRMGGNGYITTLMKKVESLPIEIE